MKNSKTPFELAVSQHLNGQLQTPTVSMGGIDLNYFSYQLAVHKYNIGLMAMGIKFSGIKFSEIKKYYGFKGRSAKGCKIEIEELLTAYKNGNIKF